MGKEGTERQKQEITKPYFALNSPYIGLACRSGRELLLMEEEQNDLEICSGRQERLLYAECQGEGLSAGAGAAG